MSIAPIFAEFLGRSVGSNSGGGRRSDPRCRGGSATLGAGRAGDQVPALPHGFHVHKAAPSLPSLWQGCLWGLLQRQGTPEVQELRGGEGVQ